MEKDLEKLEDLICEKVANLINEGKLTTKQMYEKLGCPTMNKSFARIDFSYSQYISELKKLTKNGCIGLADSSWGNEEAQTDECKDTKPGLNDMHPDSFGYNNIGGPTYKISVNKERVIVEAHFCHQEFEGWSDLRIEYVWQHRTFVFKPIEGDASSQNAILEPFGEWIIYKFVLFTIDKIRNEQMGNFVSDYIDGVLGENQK